MESERDGEMQQEKRHKAFHSHSGIGGGRDHCVHVPIDVILNILCRLSVRTIGKFRCVCKQWHSLTRDRRFVLEQHERGAFSRPPSIVQTSTRISYPPPNLIPVVAEQHDAYDMYLWNPATREVAEFSTSGRRGLNALYPGLHGFGYDASTGEYKLVSIYSGDHRGHYECEVLTLGSRAWRHLGQVTYNFAVGRQLDAAPVFVEGAIHWVVQCPPLPISLSGLTILTFDTKEEKFGKILLPRLLKPITNIRLMELRGHLAAVLWEDGDQYLSIWGLKSYAGRKWMGCRIDCSGYPFRLPMNVAAIFFAGKTLVVLDDKSGVYSYDFRSKNLTQTYDLSSSLRVAAYSESLLSPGEIIGRQSSS